MGWRNGLQSLHQTQLRTRPKVRVHVRALLRAMAKLGLDRLVRVTVRDGLARDRMPAKRVMTQRSEPSCPLDGHHGALVAADIARERPVLGEQELRAGGPLAHVATDCTEDVLGELEDVGLVVFSRRQGRARD
jgi:hypothetical protein